MKSHGLRIQMFAHAITSTLVLLGFAVTLAPSAKAVMLKRAELTAVVNDVKMLERGKVERSAGVRDLLEGDSSLKTGIKSRAELLFQDKTLTRLGANTLFSFDEGTRNLELEHGTMLLQTPKGLGGARIRTAAVTAAISGTTILLEYSPAPWTQRQPPGVSPLVAAMAPEQCVLELEHPSRKYSAPDLGEIRRKAALAKKAGGFVKVMVLEGTLRLYLNNRIGESVLVNAGHMIILSPNAASIPPSVEFDIARLAQSSLLVNNKYWGGSSTDVSMAAVSREIETQDKQKNAGDLSPSGLRILGGGTNVIFGGDSVVAQIDRGQTANPATQPPTESNNQQTTSTATSTSQTPPNIITPITHPAGPEIDLADFTREGSSTASNDQPPATSSGVSGNVTSLSILNGTVKVTPTAGGLFTLLSTAGTVDADGLEPRSATKLSKSYSLASLAANEKRFLSMDYRFMSDETTQSGSFADRFDVKIESADGTQSVVYTIDRDALSPGGNGSLTAIARAGVGGFTAGTDWLPLTLDISPLGSNPKVSFIIYDRGDPVIDSAAAVDNVKLSINPANPTAAALPGTLTLTLDAVTLGSAAGEYTIPDLKGLPAKDGTGEAADAGTFIVNATGAITVNGAIDASTGENGAGVANGGKGGTVKLTSSTGEIAVNSTVKVSGNTGTSASKAGGSILLTTHRTTGAGITISNTAQLLALLNATATGPGGTVKLVSDGAKIHVNGGAVTATNGTIDMQNTGANGLIELTAAQLAADVIKVGALGSNGELTITAGSQLSAGSVLKLYAGDATAGRVLFTGSGNITLNGTAIDIAGKTVEVSNDTHVNNNGTTRIFTDNASFGIGAGGGKFQNPVTTSGFAGRPGF